MEQRNLNEWLLRDNAKISIVLSDDDETDERKIEELDAEEEEEESEIEEDEFNPDLPESISFMSKYYRIEDVLSRLRQEAQSLIEDLFKVWAVKNRLIIRNREMFEKFQKYIEIHEADELRLKRIYSRLIRKQNEKILHDWNNKIFPEEFDHEEEKLFPRNHNEVRENFENDLYNDDNGQIRGAYSPIYDEEKKEVQNPTISVDNPVVEKNPSNPSNPSIPFESTAFSPLFQNAQEEEEDDVLNNLYDAFQMSNPVPTYTRPKKTKFIRKNKKYYAHCRFCGRLMRQDYIKKHIQRVHQDDVLAEEELRNENDVLAEEELRNENGEENE